MQTMNRRYGQIRDPHDDRDKTYKLPAKIVLPTSVNNQKFCSPIRNQGQRGACTGFAGTEALAFDRNVQNLPSYTYSPLYLYYWTRQSERKAWQPDGDVGATIRGTIKTAIKRGVCSEQSWAYDTNGVLDRPPSFCDVEAIAHKGLVYERVPQDITHIKTVLLTAPLIFGIVVYESFESNEVASTGMVPLPDTEQEDELGGHALMSCGYRADDHLIVPNSWGEWGDHGYCYIPIAYLTSRKLANDLWTIRTVQ